MACQLAAAGTYCRRTQQVRGSTHKQVAFRCMSCQLQLSPLFSSCLLAVATSNHLQQSPANGCSLPAAAAAAITAGACSSAAADSSLNYCCGNVPAVSAAASAAAAFLVMPGTSVRLHDIDCGQPECAFMEDQQWIQCCKYRDSAAKMAEKCSLQPGCVGFTMDSEGWGYLKASVEAVAAQYSEPSKALYCLPSQPDCKGGLSKCLHSFLSAAEAMLMTQHSRNKRKHCLTALLLGKQPARDVCGKILGW